MTHPTPHQAKLHHLWLYEIFFFAPLQYPVSCPRNQPPPSPCGRYLSFLLLLLSSPPSSSWPILGRVVLLLMTPLRASLAAFPRGTCTDTICQLHSDFAALSTPGCQTPKASSVGINKTRSAPAARLWTSGRPDAALKELPFGSPLSDPSLITPVPAYTVDLAYSPCSGIPSDPWLQEGERQLFCATRGFRRRKAWEAGTSGKGLHTATVLGQKRGPGKPWRPRLSRRVGSRHPR